LPDVLPGAVHTANVISMKIAARMWAWRRRSALTVVSMGTALASFGACGDAGPAEVARLEVRPEATLVVGEGQEVGFSAVAVRLDGSSYVPTAVSWSSSDPGIATISGSGVATSVGVGAAEVRAEADGASGSATLEVWVPPEVEEFAPGISYSGRRGYVEYIPGTLPLVISAPHGGDLTPEEIPDRTWGTLVTDAHTVETILAVRAAFLEETGHAPHVVLSHLKRTKLDPNRAVDEAAQESPFAELAWSEFHGFIEIAEAHVVDAFGSGLYFDLHGHGHEVPRLELGYLLSAADLSRSDAELEDPSFAARSSIRALVQSVELPFSGLLRGDVSLGGFLARQGVPSVPSPDDPSPGTDPYFSGGYSTRRHGSSQAGRTVSGVQLELHRPGIRDTEEQRRAFGLALARATDLFMREHFGFFLPLP
jgi:hypothetical protein